jgi:hypothetical protein
VSTTFARVQSLLGRMASGQPLSPGERDGLVEAAREMRARLERLRAIDPGAADGVELHPLLATLDVAPVRLAV